MNWQLFSIILIKPVPTMVYFALSIFENNSLLKDRVWLHRLFIDLLPFFKSFRAEYAN